MTRLTRPLILAGLIALTAALCTDPCSLPAAEPGATDANYAITANNDLAFDLYAQLAAKKSDRSLFFSPYSISNALVIVAEGARSETADEMGKVLRFPKALRRTGADAGERPWDLGMIHPGLSALKKQFEVANRPASKDVLDKLDALRNDLKTAIKAAKNKTEGRKAAQTARKIAAEINKLQATIDRYELRVANGLWGEKTYPFKQAYLDTIDKYYGASALSVDFRNNFEEARKRINAWVEERTRDHIMELIPPKALDKDTTLVVANAIYFKGQWTIPFNAKQTRDRPFTLADSTKVQVPTMYHLFRNAARYGAFKKDGAFFNTPRQVERGSEDDRAHYPDTDGFEVVELPYKGGEVSMVVIAPRSASGLPALEKLLSGHTLQGCMASLQGRAVNVYLPKFKMESSFNLNETLEKLGMMRAFRAPGTKDGAQFDGMCDTKDALEKLYISKVLHKAFVEVNEKGTEAAAATAVLGKKKKKSDDSVPFTPTFRADKPFVFLIREQKTGAILFLGRVMNPKTGG
jgi:serine protease inhibitor